MTHRTNGFRSGAVTYGLRWDCRSHGGRHARRDLLYPAAEEYPLTARSTNTATSSTITSPPTTVSRSKPASRRNSDTYRSIVNFR